MPRRYRPGSWQPTAARSSPCATSSSPPAAAGRCSRSARSRAGHRRAPAAAPEVRRAATVAAYVSIGTEPGTGPLLDALRAAGQAGDPAGAAARPRPRLGGVRRRRTRLRPRRRGLLEPTGARLGLDAVATADVVLTPGPGRGPRPGCGSAGAAAPTTGRSAGSRSAPSPARCSTTTRCSTRCPPTPTTGRSTAVATPAGVTRLAPG